jgi:hypothetical protein
VDWVTWFQSLPLLHQIIYASAPAVLVSYVYFSIFGTPSEQRELAKMRGQMRLAEAYFRTHPHAGAITFDEKGNIIEHE